MAIFKLEEHLCLIYLAFCVYFLRFWGIFKHSQRHLTLLDPCFAYVSSRQPVYLLPLLIQQLLIPNNLSLYKFSF